MKARESFRDPGWRYRIVLIAAMLVLWGVLMSFRPSLEFYFFTPGPRIGPFAQNLAHLGINSPGIKMHRTSLTVGGERQPELLQRALYNAWPGIERMKAVTIGRESESLPSGLVMGVLFYRQGEAADFIEGFPESGFRPVLQRGRAVFLAGGGGETEVLGLLRELRSADPTRVAALPLAAVMTIAGVVLTLPFCKTVEFTRPVPLSHVHLPADQVTILARTRRENLLILRIGLLLLLAALLADFVSVRIAYPLFSEWNDILFLSALLAGGIAMILIESGLTGYGVFFAYTITVFIGSMLILLPNGILIATLPSSAIATGLGLGCVTSRTRHASQVPGKARRV